jgi:hypothetical protein
MESGAVAGAGVLADVAAADTCVFFFLLERFDSALLPLSPAIDIDDGAMAAAAEGVPPLQFAAVRPA